MGVLSRSAIEARMQKDVDDPRGLVVTPRPAPGDWSEDSLNLRLGEHFLLPQSPPPPFIALDSSFSELGHVRVHVPWGSYLVVPPHNTVLGSTREFIKLPLNVSGQILTRSSVARTFVVIETAPWIHPGYRGCLTLEIANVSNTPVLLHPGTPIGQLLLLTVDGVDLGRQPPPKLSGSYIGPTFPEAPTFRPLKEQLGVIGILNPDLPSFK